MLERPVKLILEFREQPLVAHEYLRPKPRARVGFLSRPDRSIPSEHMNEASSLNCYGSLPISDVILTIRSSETSIVLAVSVGVRCRPVCLSIW